MQRGRHHRRSQEARGGADRNPTRKDPDPKMVQHLQGSHHSQGLRNPRRHGTRALLQLNHPSYYGTRFLCNSKLSQGIVENLGLGRNDFSVDA